MSYPKTSIWLPVDPMADMYPGWSPYNYCMQNPVNMVDPTGMFTDPPKKAGTENDQQYIDPDTGETYVWQFNENNRGGTWYNVGGGNLSEVSVSPNQQEGHTGYVRGAHILTSETSERFYGFRVLHNYKEEDFNINIDFSGFSAGWEDKSESNVLEGSASVHGLKIDVTSEDTYLKDRFLNIFNRKVPLKVTTPNSFNGSLYEANADGAFGVYWGGTDKKGFKISANVEASVLRGSVQQTLNIFGVNFSFTRGASYASVGAKGEIGAYYTEKGDFYFGLSGGWSWVIGKMYGVSISSSGINDQRKKKK